MKINAEKLDEIAVTSICESPKIPNITIRDKTKNITNFQSTTLENKSSFRASHTGELFFDNSIIFGADAR